MRFPVNSRRAPVGIACAVMCVAALGQQGPAPGSSSSRATSKAAVKLATPDTGALADGVYRNRFFGFTYRVPYGWVDRTDRMQGDSEPGKSIVLLAAFEHPPEATGDTVNSAVVIATEIADSYPGLKSAAEYFGPLTELTTSKGFKAVNEPYETSVGSRTLVRADFKREIGTLTMYQSSLAILAKGYIASFTFIGGSEDEVEKLVSSLSFEASGKASPKRQ
jgi:hypothetical protein